MPSIRLGRTFWSGLDAASSPLGSLLITAGLVRVLGAQEYGLLVVALAVSALSTAISPAITATTIKFVAETGGQKARDDLAIARLFTASITTVVVVDLLLIFATGLFQHSLARFFFGYTVIEHYANLNTALVLAVATVCIQQIDSVSASAIKGLERFREQAIFEFFSRAAVAVTVILIGWSTKSIIMVLWAQMCICSISVFCRTLLLRRLVRHRRLFCLPGKDEFARILRFGSWMWIYAIAAVAYTMDRVVIGRVLGPAAAAEYNVYVQLAQLIHYIPSSLFAFLFPVFSRMSVDVSEAGARAIAENYRKFQRIIVTIAMLSAVIAFALRRPLVGLFAGKAFHGVQNACFGLLVGSFAVMAFNIAPYYLLLGNGQSRRVSLVTTPSALATLVVCVPLTMTYGLAGAALARYVYAFGTLLLLVRAKKMLTRDS